MEKQKQISGKVLLPVGTKPGISVIQVLCSSFLAYAPQEFYKKSHTNMQMLRLSDLMTEVPGLIPTRVSIFLFLGFLGGKPLMQIVSILHVSKNPER